MKSREKLVMLTNHIEGKDFAIVVNIPKTKINNKRIFTILDSTFPPYA